MRDRPLTRADVIDELTKTFPDQPLEPLLEIVDAYGQESYERERERVQIAAIDLSKGDPDRLRRMIESAKADYRNVLYWQLLEQQKTDRRS